MKMLPGSLFAAALLANAIAPPAATARQAGAATDRAVSAVSAGPHREAALRVVRIIYGPDVLRITLERVLAWTLPEALAADPKMAEIEADYPGFRQKLLDSIVTDMVPLMLRRLPALWDRLVPIYQRNLSRRDLDRMYAFYDGETGRRFVAWLARSSDYSVLIEEQLATGGEAPATRADQSAIWDASLTAALEAMSVAELDELIAMSKAVGEAKIERNDAEAAEARLAWAKTPDPEMNALLEASINRIIATYPAPPAPK